MKDEFQEAVKKFLKQLDILVRQNKLEAIFIGCAKKLDSNLENEREFDYQTRLIAAKDINIMQFIKLLQESVNEANEEFKETVQCDG